MGFSPLADMRQRIPDGGRSSPRNSRITGFTVHHQAGVDIHSEAWNPSREVSANYWIKNNGDIVPHVDELRRAWTTGHPDFPGGAAADHRNITVEVSNTRIGVLLGTWAISAKARASLEALIADVHKRHGLGRVKRGLYGGVAVHQDFVNTACPGPYVMKHLGSIIANAERVRVGVPERKRGTIVKAKYVRRDGEATSGGRVVKPGSAFFLHTGKNQHANAGANVIGGVGPYSIATHATISGEPGDKVTLRLQWDNNGKKSNHYPFDVVVGNDGVGNASATFLHDASSGDRVYLHVQASEKNREPVKVTRLATAAHLYEEA